jgi:hypothetical protein
MIAAYAELLAGKLGFNPALSRRVRQEVEDHLWEAVAAEPSDNRGKAVQLAISKFGDADAIAAQFATLWLMKQMKKVGITVILVIAGVLVAMKARVAWYALSQWGLNEDVRAIARLVGLIDAYAFWVSVIVGSAGAAYVIARRSSPTGVHAAHRRLQCILLLSWVSAAALVVSVIGDGVLTALRLAGSNPSAEFLIPIVSMAIEIVCAGILILSLRTAVVGLAHTAALLKT